MSEFPTMGTIRQAAEQSGLATYRVRQLCKTGQVVSVRCGKKILVNLDALAAYLRTGDAAAPSEATNGIRRADQ